MDGESHFCSSCSNINFNALFEKDIKCYQIGTLATISDKKRCSFCRFVVQVINIVWAKWKDEVWEPSVSKRITVWVKTTFWAHYGESLMQGHSTLEELARTPHFRYRPSLGTDWVPDDRQRSSYGSPRFTLCELDRIQDTEGFEYFTNDLEQDIRQVLTRRRIPLMVDRDLLKTWIRECQTNHKQCMTAKNTQQALLRSTGKFRVVDVETNSLFVPSVGISYIAVSYVWGGILRAKTDSERTEWIDSLFDQAPTEEPTEPTSPGLHHRLRVENLPLTIRDSISLAKLMGWRYIWIDLLCIRQNDAADKEALVKNMHLIYEGASFTIVAAGGQDANTPLAGLFNPRSPESTGEVVFRNDSIVLAPARPTLPDLLADTDWTRRGWTFQEDILSRCCLYFTGTEVFYSCRNHLLEYRLPYSSAYLGFGYGRFSEWRESYVLETGALRTAYQNTSAWDDGWTRNGSAPTSLRSRATILGSQGATGTCPGLRYKITMWDPKEICSGQHAGSGGHFDSCVVSTSANERNQLFDEYASFVSQYSKRKLSDTSDAVAAMMGILNKFDVSSTPHANIEAHGILADQFEKGLLWMPLDESSLQRRTGFPSWSWAGWIGPVAYQIAHNVWVGHVWVGSSCIFWPPAFSAKMGLLFMEPFFDIHIDAEHRMIACLKESKPPKTPEKLPPTASPSQAISSGILNMYTYVAEVSNLTLETSFVIRGHRPSANVPVWLARVRDEDECIAVVPDCRSNWIATPPAGDGGNYRLAIIGRGKRQIQNDDDYGRARMSDECVVLLLERNGEYFERIGLSTVPAERSTVPAERSTDLVEQWAALEEEYKVLAEQKRAVGERSTMSPGISWILGLPSEPTGRFPSVRCESLMDPASAWSLQWISLA